jgi:hypothetical protein
MDWTKASASTSSESVMSNCEEHCGLGKLGQLATSMGDGHHDQFTHMEYPETYEGSACTACHLKPPLSPDLATVPRGPEGGSAQSSEWNISQLRAFLLLQERIALSFLPSVTQLRAPDAGRLTSPALVALATPQLTPQASAQCAPRCLSRCSGPASQRAQ